jgi:hypothetical protein
MQVQNQIKEKEGERLAKISETDDVLVTQHL